MAEIYGFDAVNADRQYLRAHGPLQAVDLLQHHHLQPGAFAFSARFNECFTDVEFEQSLAEFEQDLALCREAGYRCCVGYVQPASETLRYHEHFALLRQRLERLKPLLVSYDVRLGLEFIGPTTMRLRQKYDFIHTLDGIRGLIAAANAQDCVGLKLDAFHWYTSGAGLLDIQKLSSEEIVYVEINDALAGDYDRFTLPEFQRELPETTGIVDVPGMLRELNSLGFNGPVVVEPWNETLRNLNPSDAIAEVKRALDLCLQKAGILSAADV